MKELAFSSLLAKRVMDRKMLMMEALITLRAVGDDGPDDSAILSRFVETLAAQGDIEGLFFANSVVSSGQAQAELLGLYRWAEGGFPVVTMGHKFAAALCCTTASKEAVESARAPFPGYLLEVPEGVVAMTNPDTGLPEDIRTVIVVRNANPRTRSGWSWAYTALSNTGLVLYRYGVTSTELLPPNIETISLEGGPGVSYLLTDRDERACSIVGRLIVNTALAMSDPTKVEVRGCKRVRHKMNSPFTGRSEPEPTVRTYVLGKNIKLQHDLRPEVRRYLAGERRSPSIQVLVSGHYKMQPHGPHNSLRRLDWREPYWRGPEDAPIPIRSHVLGGET